MKFGVIISNTMCQLHVFYISLRVLVVTWHLAQADSDDIGLRGGRPDFTLAFPAFILPLSSKHPVCELLCHF